MTAAPQAPIAASVALLRREQRRVAALLAALSPSGWDGRLDDRARATLVATGHFPRFAGELDWGAQEVAGHLRDSARVFASRLCRLLVGDTGPFEDFDPLAPDRVADYLVTPPNLLLAEFDAAQEELLRTVAAVTADDLTATARRADGRPVTVADLLGFLPAHQADHAAQLTALSDAAAGARPRSPVHRLSRVAVRWLARGQLGPVDIHAAHPWSTRP